MNYFHRVLILILKGSILFVLAASLLLTGDKHLKSCTKSLPKAGFQKISMNYTISTGTGNESIMTIQCSQRPLQHWDFNY